MKTTIATLLLAVVMFCSSALAKDDGVDSFLDGFAERFSESETDIFYVSPAKEIDSRNYVYIYWMNGSAILIVEVPTKRLDDYTWYESKARIDLGHEVVPTTKDVGSSTYLVDSKWAEDRLKECLSSGRKIIKKNKTAEPGATDNPDGAQ